MGMSTRIRTARTLAGTALVLTAALSLTACGADPADPEATPTSSATETTEDPSASEGGTEDESEDASATASPTESATPTDAAGVFPPDEEALAGMVAAIEEHLGPHSDTVTRTASEMKTTAEEAITAEEARLGDDFSAACVADLAARDAVHRTADIAYTQVNGTPQDMDTVDPWFVNRWDTASPVGAAAVRDATVAQTTLPHCTDEPGLDVPEVERSEEAAGEVTVEHLVHGNLEDGGMRTVQTLAVDGARVYEVNHPAMGAEQAEELKARHVALLEDLRPGDQDG